MISFTERSPSAQETQRIVSTGSTPISGAVSSAKPSLGPAKAKAAEKAMPKKLLAGRSAHVAVTMAMPAFAYRWFYGAHGIRGMERNILKFVGLSPVRKSYLGSVEGISESRRLALLEAMRKDGARLR